jgi:methylenetetrahydrofolate--tRNA-(uracil-5-)-methyltransferase
MSVIHIIGGGLAGSEAAWQAAQAGCRVVLHEMRPKRMTEAHTGEALAELVCSNSFRSDDWENNAVGLLHEEMRRLGSLIMRAADAHKLPAGGALAVDRAGVIVATGPLTSPALSQTLRALTGEDSLAFFDAIAPIVERESIDMGQAWLQSRYDKKGPGGGDADYINCALTEEQYRVFVSELLKADVTEFHDWEKSTPYFEGCLPIEVMAARGMDTLRFGPMKPVGLRDPKTGSRPYAVVQLRQDNTLGTLWNMVGFQTKLKYGEQSRILRLIPALKDARFARLGGIHRNTFLNSPRLLDEELRLRARPALRFAGQITGVEGYVESAAIGLLAGLFAGAGQRGERLAPPPPTTALGALLAHITRGADAATFQPMNVNFGLFPPLDEASVRGRDRKRVMARRALADLDAWLGRKAAAE